MKIYSTKDGRVPVIEYLPAAAGSYQVGQPLVFSGGKLTAVTSGAGQDTAMGRHYVCLSETTLAAADELPVVAANEDIVWEIPLEADGAVTVGAGYCLSANGMALTGTGTNGCFTVTASDGAKAGDLQRGYLD